MMIKTSKHFVYVLVLFFCAQCGAQGTSMWLDDAPQTKRYVSEVFDGGYAVPIDDDPWFADASPIKPGDRLNVLVYTCELFEELALTAWDFGGIQAMVILRRSLDRGEWSQQDKETAVEQQRRAARLVKNGDFQTVAAIREAARRECDTPRLETLHLPIHMDGGW